MVDARPTGKRELWDNRADALASAELIARQARNDGAASFVELSPAERRDAGQALAILDGTARTLVDAASHLVRELAHQRAAAHVPSVAEAAGLYLAAKRQEAQRGDISPLTIRELESRMRTTCVVLGAFKVNAVDESMVTKFIRGLPTSARNRHNVQTKLSQLFNFCRREKWIATNPAENVTVRVKRREVEILSVALVRRLLSVASSSPEAESIVPFLTLQLFGGLRPGEAAQLHWNCVHFETGQLEVKAATSKSRETRFVPLEPVLLEILMRYRRAHGLVVSREAKRALRDVKVAAGLGTWPADVLRHCYGSYWLAVHHDRARLAELMGNSLSVIKQHYRRAIPEAAACEYWALPGARIVEFKQPAA
jgi:integrase